MFLICGEALFDVFVTGSAGDALRLEAHPGGSPFNVAIGLARLGQPVAFLGGISPDLLGERLVAKLRAEGIDTASLQRPAAPTTLGLVGLGDDGVPAYAFYGEGAADRRLSAEALPAPSPAIRAIHLGSYATVVEPTAGALEALVRRERPRCLIAYDPNVRLNVEPELATWHARVDTLAGLAHLIKISDEDVRLLYGELPHDELAARWLAGGAKLVVVTRGAAGAIAWNARGCAETPGIPVALVDTVGAGDTFQAAMLAWLAGGAKLVVVTRGAAGAIAWNARGCAETPGVPVALVDTVGAGDTFQAAMLAWLAEHACLAPAALAELAPAQLESLLAFAAQAAAITCSRRGADLPRRTEIGD